MATKQPADQSHFILPDLGEGVHEAEIIRWRVTPGETVQEHQTLAEMETDKALVEVPSPWTGVIKELHGSEGEIVNVGNRLVTYDIGGGAAPAAPAPAEAVEVTAEDSEDACIAPVRKKIMQKTIKHQETLQLSMMHEAAPTKKFYTTKTTTSNQYSIK